MSLDHESDASGLGAARSGALEALEGDLAASMLPVLLHKLSNATQLVASWNALLALEGGAELALSRATDFARASMQVEELGWLLAALATASGADLVMERRERRALSIFLAILRDVLRREGRDLAYAAEQVPDLSSRALGGWEMPFALCTWIHRSARAPRSSGRIELGWTRQGEHCVFRVTGGGTAGLAEGSTTLLERLPGSVLSTSATGFELAAPLEWFAANAGA